MLALSAAVAVLWLASRPGRNETATIQRAEAIATWAEMLRDATGTPRGIEGVLVSTASSAPLPIRNEVLRFAHRIGYQPMEEALPELADDLNDPNGDLIVGALSLAATSGGRDIRAVLDSLASAARDEARMRRRLEVSRQQPRAEMRQVVFIIVVVVAVLSVWARDYLSAYGSLSGQLVLTLAAVFWVGGFARMAQLSKVPKLQRVLTRRSEA